MQRHGDNQQSNGDGNAQQSQTCGNAFLVASESKDSASEEDDTENDQNNGNGDDKFHK
jgi:hypothetical protein